jgi:hypothetical protein
VKTNRGEPTGCVGSHAGADENTFKNSVGRTEGKKLSGKPRSKCGMTLK